MNNIQQIVRDYFAPRQLHFWRWTATGEAIESLDGQTICYTHDLAEVLRGLEDTGLPELGTVLLVLAACQGKTRFGEDQTPESPGLQALWTALTQQPAAAEVLDWISRLPPGLRKGRSRIALIRAILQVGDPAEMALLPIPAGAVRELVDEFASGRHDAQLFQNDALSNQHVFYRSKLKYLRQTYLKTGTKEIFENYLRSGLLWDPLESTCRHASLSIL